VKRASSFSQKFGMTYISNTTGNKGFLRLREKFGMTHTNARKSVLLLSQYTLTGSKRKGMRSSVKL
jgi:D-Tyr-tRNAtyr deacylase